MSASRFIINVEALIKYSTPQKGQSGWIQPKLSTRQIAVLKKHVTRDLKMEWPLPETQKKLNPEKQCKLTIWERNQVPRQKKIKEAVANMPKLIAEKLKVSIEKKKKEENNLTALIPNYLPGGPYGNNDSPKVMALRKIAAREKQLKREKMVSLTSQKGQKKNKTK